MPNGIYRCSIAKAHANSSTDDNGPVKILATWYRSHQLAPQASLCPWQRSKHCFLVSTRITLSLELISRHISLAHPNFFSHTKYLVFHKPLHYFAVYNFITLWLYTGLNLKLTFSQISPSSTIGSYLTVLRSLTVIETVGKLLISVSC